MHELLPEVLLRALRLVVEDGVVAEHVADRIKRCRRASDVTAKALLVRGVEVLQYQGKLRRLRYFARDKHTVAENLNKLPEATKRVLDRATQHSGKNCTVCKQSVPGVDCEHTSEAVKIPKPVPVSKRMPEPSIYNEEPTLRPAQSPAVALATVLKALEDELAHLRMQLVSYQGAYNKLDASISKRQRKTLTEKIEKLLKPVDEHVRLAKEEQGADALQFKIAVRGSFACNIILAILQFYGATSSGSLSLFTTMADAIFDPMRYARSCTAVR